MIREGGLAQLGARPLAGTTCDYVNKEESHRSLCRAYKPPPKVRALTPPGKGTCAGTWIRTPL